MNIYKGSFKSTCPSDGDIVSYNYSIISERTIMVEDILDFLSKYPEVYQEALADDMFKRFGGYQIIKGVHQGVEITTLRH